MKFETSRLPKRLSTNHSWIFYILCFCLASCSNSSETTAVNDSADSVLPKKTLDSGQKGISAMAQFSGDLYKLELTKTQYTALKASSHHDKLIFQFYFKPADPTYPTLIAYASEKKNKVNPIKSEILTPTIAFFRLPAEAIFGDQEIDMTDIDRFVTGTVGSGNYTLVFVPDIDANKHIFYHITIENLVAPPPIIIQTNPSPPKDAN